MATLDEQIAQLESAIAAQETLRPTLGDAVVQVTVAALQAQLKVLRAQLHSTAQPELKTPEQLLALMQTYLPKELAEKIRATGRIEGERKQVTVMFADIAGFTALSERLDPEVLASLTDDILKDMAEAIYQHEGYVDKFLGDGVMAVFGAPITHEDDPARALRAAISMRERLEQFNRRWAERLGTPLNLHIGINTGQVIAGNVGSDLRLSYTVMGDTVNTASRLENASEPGQILVSRDTFRLTQEAFTFTSLEPITVKGKREPLTVYELQRARLQPGTRRGLEGQSSKLVGREREMAQLRSVAQGLEAGHGRVVTVTGEAGIGKSRLMAEWRSELGERVRWLEGRSFAHTTSLAFGPFLDLLRRYANIKDDDSEAEARAHFQAAIENLFPGHLEARAIFSNVLTLRLAPDEEQVIANLPAEVLRRRLFALVEELFTQLARERPLILVIEDMHWADTTSIELVESLLPLIRQVPFAMVGVFRSHSGQAPVKFQSMIETQYLDVATTVSLSPLSERGSVEMVQQLLATPELATTLRSIILDKSEGNPFFVEEVIRTLIDRGALMRTVLPNGNETWIATALMESISVPDTLQGLLMARLDRLPGETKWVVQQASVIGRIFLYRVLLRMAEHVSGLDADLSHLEREELIRERARDPEVEYIFKHALTQEVAYQSLLVPRRKSLHIKVGVTMEAIFADRLGEFQSIIGEHMLRGEAWEQAVQYLSRAADAAMRLYAFAEARLHVADVLKALSFLPDNERNRRRRVDMLIKQVSISFVSDSPEINMARLGEAESLLKDLPGPDGTPGSDRLRLARVQFWMGRIHYYRGAPREAIGYFRQVLAVAQEFGDEDLSAIPGSVIGQAMITQGHYGKAVPLLAQAIAPLEKNANWPDWIRTVGFHGFGTAARGEYAAGLAQVERAYARALETNYLTGIGTCHLLLWLTHFMGNNAPRMLEEGRASIQAAEQSGDRLSGYFGYAFRGWAESRLGQHAAARASMAQSQALAQRIGGQLLLADFFAVGSAEIAFNAGRYEETITILQTSEPVIKTVNNLLSLGLLQRWWALALLHLDPAAGEDADRRLATSLQLLETGECVLEAARTQAAWGEVCQVQGKREAALEHYNRAAAQFETSGLTHELERVHTLQEAC